MPPRLSALLAAPLVLLLGCDAPSSLPADPVSSSRAAVLDLQADLVAGRYADAATRFDPPRDVAAEAWHVDPSALSIGPPPALWPLGPDDQIEVVQASAYAAEVRLLHAERHDKDLRPRSLTLHRLDGAWRVVDWASY